MLAKKLVCNLSAYKYTNAEELHNLRVAFISPLFNGVEMQWPVTPISGYHIRQPHCLITSLDVAIFFVPIFTPGHVLYNYMFVSLLL